MKKKLSLQYYLKLKSNPNNPTHQVVFEPLYKDEFLEKEKVIPLSVLAVKRMWIALLLMLRM